MRPEMTPERLARLEAMWLEARAHPPDGLDFIKVLPQGPALEKTRDMMMAGWWLEEELLAAGASQIEAKEQCFACGQHSFEREAWDVARMVLDNWMAGKPVVPGHELADQIFAERLKG